MSKEEIFTTVRKILIESFEADPSAVTPEARLADDLDLDSIDAVDLIVNLQQHTSVKMDPQSFKQARTINDVVEAIFPLLGGKPA